MWHACACECASACVCVYACMHSRVYCMYVRQIHAHVFLVYMEETNYNIYIYLFIYLSIYIYRSNCIPVYLPTDLSLSVTSLPTYIIYCVCTYLYIYVYFCLSISIYLYLSLSLSLYICLSLSISFYQYLSISFYQYLSISISLSILSISTFDSLPILEPLSIYLSIHPPTYLQRNLISISIQFLSVRKLVAHHLQQYHRAKCETQRGTTLRNHWANGFKSI